MARDSYARLLFVCNLVSCSHFDRRSAIDRSGQALNMRLMRLTGNM